MSPARPQDMTFIAHLLFLTNLCPTFFLKLFFPASLLTQANANQNHPSNKSDSPARNFSQADHPDQFELKP